MEKYPALRAKQAKEESGIFEGRNSKALSSVWVRKLSHD